MCDINIVGPQDPNRLHHPRPLHCFAFWNTSLEGGGLWHYFHKGCMCHNINNGNIILIGEKDPSTNLRTLPLGTQDMTSQHAPSTLLSVALVMPTPMPPLQYRLHLLFKLSVQRLTAFASLTNHYAAHNCPHYSRWSTKVTSKGCPNLTAHGITKYLNPSPATAKGHIKCPHQGIQNTCAACEGDISPHIWLPVLPNTIPEPIANADVINLNDINNIVEHEFPMHVTHANVIESDEESDGYAFVFAAFADKWEGTLYMDFTGAFPFISLEGNVVSSLCTTTKPMLLWQLQLQVLKTTISSPPINVSLNYLSQKANIFDST